MTIYKKNVLFRNIHRIYYEGNTELNYIAEYLILGKTILGKKYLKEIVNILYLDINYMGKKKKIKADVKYVNQHIFVEKYNETFGRNIEDTKT